MNKEKFLEKLEKHYHLNPKKVDRYYELGMQIAETIERSGNYATSIARLALADKSDIMKERNRLAEKGIEYTPAEMEEYLKIIRIVLECL